MLRTIARIFTALILLALLVGTGWAVSTIAGRWWTGPVAVIAVLALTLIGVWAFED